MLLAKFARKRVVAWLRGQTTEQQVDVPLKQAMAVVDDGLDMRFVDRLVRFGIVEFVDQRIGSFSQLRQLSGDMKN
jgi:hypothetical protein